VKEVKKLDTVAVRTPSDIEYKYSLFNNVKKREIISSINKSDEQITIQASKLSLLGLTTINNLFKVNLDGSIEAVNGKFSGDITLSNGSKIVGESGLLITYQIQGSAMSSMFAGANTLVPLGYSLLTNDGIGNITSTRDRLEFKFSIPKGFIIKSAFVRLEALPVDHKWRDSNYNLQTTSGYIRNFKLYKSTSFSNGKLINYYDSTEPLAEQNITYSEVSNAFGSNGFSGYSNAYNTATSIDIKSHIVTSALEDKYNVLKVESVNNPPVTITAMFEQTGALQGTLYITGYTKFE
jgi:hypothetical protein